MPEQELPDLIIKLKKGEIPAFRSIYNLYHHRIYNFCLKLLPTSEDARDAVQKVFVSLWEQRHLIDETKPFTAYIYAIARYTAYSDFKKLLYHKAAFENFTIPDYAIPEAPRDELLYKELSDILNRIIEQLPPQRRMIFRLNRFYQLTYRAIADKLQITENTVDTQIRRALEFIRKEYEKYLK